MPPLRFHQLADPRAMLAAALDGVLEVRPTVPDGWPTLPAWIVVRQGGLRDDVHAHAAQRGVPGWFGAPVVTFAELFARWGPPEPPPPLSDAERWVLVAALLDRHGRGRFPRTGGVEAWVPHVDRLLGELVGEGVEPAAFADATAALDAAADRDRWAVIAAVHAAWNGAVAARGRRDERGDRVALARWIADAPDAFARRLDGRAVVRVVGLADLRGGWAPLLRALSGVGALRELAVYTGVPLPLPPDLAREVVTPPGPPAGLAAVLFTSDPPRGAFPTVRIVEAPDPARELETMAVSVRSLVDAGVAPARIAVVARDARPSVNHAARVLRLVGVPVTTRRRIALPGTAPAQAVLALLDAAAQGWSRHALAEVAEHPLLALGLDPALVNAVGFARPVRGLEGWRAAFGALAVAAGDAARAGGLAEADGDDPRRFAGSAIHAAVAWRAVEARLAPLDAPRPTAAWLRWVQEVLTDPAWGVAARIGETSDPAVAEGDAAAVERILEITRDWEGALASDETRGGPVSAAQFADRLRLLLDADLVTLPETDQGVLVTEAQAFAWRATDHLFVVGAIAGAFPRRPPVSPLLSPAVRDALADAGLPLDRAALWRVRERELFRALVAGAGASLTVSWSAVDDHGRDAAPSAFVEELHEAAERGAAAGAAPVVVRLPADQVLVPGFPVVPNATVAALARDSASRERARDASASPWNGLLTSPAATRWLRERFGEAFRWSPTQLEKVAMCPWRWFADRALGLAPRFDPDELLDPRVRGSVAHAALDRFYAEARAMLGDPVYLRAEHAEWATAAIARAVEAAWAAAGDETWLGAPALAAVARAELIAELVRFVQAEIAEHETSFTRRGTAGLQVRTGVSAGEVVLEGVPFEVEGIRFVVTGRIDRVERGVDDRIADAASYAAVVDYKSSRSSTPARGEPAGWADGVVLQLPLYAEALRAMCPDLTVARVEYRVLRSGEAVHRVAPVQLSHDGVIAPDAAAAARLAAAVAAAARRVAAVRAGTLPAAPAPSCGCPPFCVARDVCRIPGGPREAQR